MRTVADERELPVQSYEYLAGRGPVDPGGDGAMLACVSIRKYKVVGEPVGEEVCGRLAAGSLSGEPGTGMGATVLRLPDGDHGGVQDPRTV